MGSEWFSSFFYASFAFLRIFTHFFVFFRFSSFFFVFLRFSPLLLKDKGEQQQYTAKMGNFTPTPSAPTPCKTSRKEHRQEFSLLSLDKFYNGVPSGRVPHEMITKSIFDNNWPWPLCRKLSGTLWYKIRRILSGIFLEDLSGHFSPQNEEKNTSDKIRRKSGGSIGNEKCTRTFFCTNFLNALRGPGCPGKSPGTSQIPPYQTQGRQTFEGGQELFDHYPFGQKTPTPPGGLRT